MPTQSNYFQLSGKVDDSATAAAAGNKVVTTLQCDNIKKRLEEQSS